MRISLLLAFAFATTPVLMQAQLHESIIPAVAPPLDPIPQYSMHLKECRIAEDTPGATPHFRRDRQHCEVVAHFYRNHWIQRMVNGKPKWVNVLAEDLQIALHNDTPQEMTFLVDQPLPKGWSISSKPQPVAIVGKSATFRVVAQPGETVPLEMRERKFGGTPIAIYQPQP